MKSKISKVLLVLLSAVLALGIASCAPQDPKTPEQPEEPAYWEDHSAVVEGEAESSLFPEFPAVQQLDCVEYDFGNSNVYDSPDIFNEVATLSCLQGLALKSGNAVVLRVHHALGLILFPVEQQLTLVH